MSTIEQNGWTDETDRAPEDSTDGNVSRETPTDEDEGGGVSNSTHDDGEDEDTDGSTTDEDEGTDEGDETPTDDKTKLRGEAAKYRRQRNEERARADAYGARLFTELVRSTGKLTDPTDMPVNVELLDDGEKLTAAIDDLLQQKPHLKARQFADMRQHDKGANVGPSLGEMLRRNS